MRHGWLAFVVLAAFAGEARAWKPISCWCTTRTEHPSANESAPANSKLWILEPVGAVHTPSRRPTHELLGVKIREPGGGVTLGTVRDDDAPASPSGATVSIVTSGFAAYAHVESLSINGIFAQDTAFIRVDIKDADGYVQLLIHRNNLYVCDPGFTLASHRVEIELRAIDLAGNESAPVALTIDTTPAYSSKADVDCKGRAGEWLHHHRGHGYEILALLFFWFVFVVAWALIVAIRRLTAKRTPAEPVAHLEAEEVVRRMTRWLFVWSAMLLASMIGLHSLGKETTSIYAFCLFPFTVSAIGRLWIAHRARRLLDKPEADAVRHGRWLCVTTLRDSVLLRAEDIDFVVARHRSIPRSVVK